MWVGPLCLLATNIFRPSPPLYNSQTFIHNSGTKTASQTLGKAGATDVTCNDGLLEVILLPFADALTSVTGNNTSNFTSGQSLHSFSENVCYCSVVHFRNFLVWQKKWQHSTIFPNPNNICKPSFQLHQLLNLQTFKYFLSCTTLEYFSMFL